MDNGKLYKVKIFNILDSAEKVKIMGEYSTFSADYFNKTKN